MAAILGDRNVFKGREEQSVTQEGGLPIVTGDQAKNVTATKDFLSQGHSKELAFIWWALEGLQAMI